MSIKTSLKLALKTTRKRYRTLLNELNELQALNYKTKAVKARILRVKRWKTQAYTTLTLLKKIA